MPRSELLVTTLGTKSFGALEIVSLADASLPVWFSTGDLAGYLAESPMISIFLLGRLDRMSESCKAID